MPFTRLKKALGFAAEEKSVTLTDQLAYEVFGVSPTSTGVSVSAASAMRVPAVACATGLIAETVGTLPVKVYERDTKQAATDHPAYRLIHHAANPWTSCHALREMLTTDALLHGSGYALATRLGNGTPHELHRLDPSTVTPETANDGTPLYRIQMADGPREYSYEDVLHVQPFGGVSPITLGREAIALSIAFERHMAQVFANGARPSGVIRADKSLDVEAKRRIAASWFNTHSGKSAGGTAVLDEGMSYETLSMTLTDAQFAENRIEQIREIARIFRVPPTLLFELTRGTWSNSETMARQFHTMTLAPWLTNWEWAYTRVLLTPEDRETHYIEFNTDALLSADHAAKAAAYATYRSAGVMTANEVRQGLNLPERPDGDDLANPYTTSHTDAANTPAAPSNPEDDAA